MAGELTFGDYQFARVCAIEPERDADGAVRIFAPQLRISKPNLIVHEHGLGPFCNFRIPREYRKAGVYILTVDDSPRYVGECRDLLKRYNNGYGHISPRNCFEGGRRTNCRINNLIYHAVTSGSHVDLWFFATSNYKEVEKELLTEAKRFGLEDLWNRKDYRHEGVSD